jgi:hypothetical protein
VASDFASIQNILLKCLDSDKPRLAEIIHSACNLSRYSRWTGRGQLPLLDCIQKFLPELTEQHELQAYFIIQLLDGWDLRSIPNVQQLMEEALEHLNHFHDSDLECELIPDLPFVHLS